MSYNASIILQGRSPDIVNALARGDAARQQRLDFDNQNAMRDMLRTQGAGIMAGDQQALNALAQFDPSAALGIQGQRLDMDYKKRQISALDESQRREAEAYAKGLTAEQRAAEAAQLEGAIKQALAAPTPEAFDAMMVEMGRPDMVGQFANRQTLAMPLLELTDILKMVTPPATSEMPADFQSLKLRAEAAGLKPGTPEYQSFMAQGAGGGAPAAFVALDMQAKAAGFEPGTPAYQEFMATRGAGLQAQAKVEGTAAGEAVTGLGSAVAKGEQAIQLIDQIATDPALPSILGIVQGNLPAGTPIIGGGQVGADLGAKIEQLQGQVFLEAFESLKGGGAITEIEGQKAERAKARLNRAQSPEAYRIALSELREVIELGIERAQKRAETAKGNMPGGTGAASAAAPQAGAPVQITSDEEYDALPSGTEFVGPDGKTRRKP